MGQYVQPATYNGYGYGQLVMGNRLHKNIRMRGWDYSQAAVYMGTVCVKDRSHRFGSITIMDEVHMNSAGIMVSQEIGALSKHYAAVEVDQFVVMPNHIHLLVGINLTIGPSESVALSDVVGDLKSRTTNRYIKGVKMGLLPAFDRKLWQEGFYETIMRDERMTEERRNYIINNPANWRDDPEMNR